MEKKIQMEGVCPKCKKENLEFDGIKNDGQMVGYRWECLDCGCQGIEWYNLTFSHHEITAE